MTIRRRPRLPRRLLAAGLAAVVLWLAAVSAYRTTAASTVQELARQGGAALELLRSQLGYREGPSLPGPVALAISQSPLLLAGREEVLRSRQETDEPAPMPPHSREEETTPESSVPIREEAARPGTPLIIADNGVPARTLVPTSPEGYVVWRDVYIDNRSDRPLTAENIDGGFAAALPAEGPQILIVHTHGSEAYTMPEGQAYIPSSEYRTTDCSCNVVRVGEELRAALEEAGLQVIHDTTLHDYPRYSGAYDRSLATVQAYLEQHPTIAFVLDIHRDAVTDAQGNPYKVVSQVAGVNAAQMTFVVGTDGGGLEHPRWTENLRLAAAVQQRLAEDCPTLMRPITVRNSRYNQHTTTGSLLVEMGAAGNSLDEALLSARLLAKALVEVLIS